MPLRGERNLTSSSKSRRPGSKKFGSGIFIKEEHLVIWLNYEKEAALQRKTEEATVFSFTG